MWIHIVLLISICAVGGVCYSNGVSPRKNKIFLIVSLTLIFFVQGFRRLDVGIDTPTYVSGFYRINLIENSFEKTRWEPLYVLINQLIWNVSENHQILLIVVSIIILSGFGVFIYHNVPKNNSAFWPIFFFMTLNHYFTSMVSLRQYCALAIGINIYTVLNNTDDKRKWLKAVILLIVSVMFHQSAICLVLLMIFCGMRKFTKEKIIGFSILGVAVFFLFDVLLKIAFLILPVYQGYAESGKKFEGVALSEINTVFLILKVIVCVLAFKLNESNVENQKLLKLVAISFVGILISLLTTKVQLIWRFGYYYDVFLIILIPEFLNHFRKEKILGYSFLFIIGWIYYIVLMKMNYSQCIPYYFCWK
ncbi:EpsG family protein [Fournierella massiliensis]|uniref:EpsG family protein n=1 Tax=Allofournierella massiliensis TaxID=1650663 RepID=UPI0035226CCA